MTHKYTISDDNKEIVRSFYKIILIFLIVFICTSAFCGCVSAADFSGGSGTEADPFLISSAADLKHLATKVNAGNNYSGKYFKVTNDIDLSEVCSETLGSWVRIGNYNPFSGNFDGDGHNISNLYIYVSWYNPNRFGLFGYALNANFTNVTLTNVNLTGRLVQSGAGGLVGNNVINRGTHFIKNCSVSGKVDGRSYGFYYGLLIGKNSVNNGTLFIENCSMYGKVFIVYYQNNAGGMIGYNSVDNGTIKIENCRANVDCGNGLTIGGLIGGNSAKNSSTTIISKCYFVGSFKGSQTRGGLIGSNSAVNSTTKIINCYTYVNPFTNDYGLGGLIGVNSLDNSTTKIENCYAAGEVNAHRQSGGLIGLNNIKNNSKTYVNNSAALNQYVNGSNFNIIGRIYGDDSYGSSTPKLNNNYGWEGMNNKDTFFTDSYKNGKNASSIQVWANESFYKDILQWDISNTSTGYNSIWKIIKNDDNENEYPLPFLNYLGKDDSLREKVIYLKPMIVTFNGNDETSGEMSEQGFTLNIYKPLSKINFTKTGYTFIGWNNSSTDFAGIEVNFDDEEIMGFDTPNPTPDKITLYAVWKPNITNVTLNFNNGTLLNKTVNISYDSREFNETPLTKPEYANYRFMGYYNSSSGGIQVINSTLQLVPNAVDYTNASGYWANDTRNIELWAVWTLKVTNVKLNFNNSSGLSEYVNITYGDNEFNETPLTKPTKPGYTFTGYNNSSSGGGVRVIDENLELISDVPDYTNETGYWINETLFAELWATWKANSYNITFHKNYGTDDTYNQSYEYEETKNLIPNTFTREGHKFAGWSTTPTGTVVYDDENPFTYSETNDINLYAVWEVLSYNITFHKNYGTDDTYNQSYEYEETKNLIPNTFTREGHKFVGWSKTPTGTVVYDDENSFTYSETNDINLYAVWEVLSYNITFHKNYGTDDTYNQSYEYEETKNLIPNTFTREGHKFVGWSKTPTGTVVYDNENSFTYSETNDINLYAVWEKIPEPPSSSGSSSYYTPIYIGGINTGVIIGENITVFFNSTGGSHVDDQTNLHRGDKVTEPMNPTKDGYIFDAWYTADAYKWDFNNDTVNKSFTLYANWTAIPKHHCCCCFWIIVFIAAELIACMIIKIYQNIKRDEENFEKLS